MKIFNRVAQSEVREFLLTTNVLEVDIDVLGRWQILIEQTF